MAAINIQAQVDPYPPVASFQGIQSPNSPTLFDENVQPGLDSSLQESGLGSAVQNVLMRINEIHRSHWRGFYKNFMLYQWTVIIVYVIIIVANIAVFTVASSGYYSYYISPIPIVTVSLVLFLLFGRRSIASTNQNIAIQRSAIIQDFNNRYISRGIFLEWQDFPVIILVNDRSGNAVRRANARRNYARQLLGTMTVHLKVNHNLRARGSSQGTETHGIPMHYNQQPNYTSPFASNQQPTYSPFQPPPSYDAATFK